MILALVVVMVGCETPQVNDDEPNDNTTPNESLTPPETPEDSEVDVDKEQDECAVDSDCRYYGGYYCCMTPEYFAIKNAPCHEGTGPCPTQDLPEEVITCTCENKECVEHEPEQEVPAEAASSVVEANNLFGFDMYAELKDDPSFAGENIFFSPHSISFALGMTQEGALGETAEEMRSVLYLPEDATTRRAEFKEIYDRINAEGKEFELHTANAIWPEQTFDIKQEFADVVKNYYGGESTPMDYKNDPEGSRVEINDWVEEQTNNKIVDLIPAGYIDTLTKLVLTNAIYFKANWFKQFEEEATEEADFYKDDGSTVTAELMHDVDYFNYYETGDVQMAELLYNGTEVSMLVILPKENNIEAVEESLGWETLKGWREEMESKRLDLYLPKFTFETKKDLNRYLIELGMSMAFSGSAEFEDIGVPPEGPLYISNVIHQAFIAVDENGTEAAAATAVIMKAMAAGPVELPDPIEFKADHPFLFIIQERESGNILFMGRIMDPTA